jgi:LacI family transcriptional regulator
MAVTIKDVARRAGVSPITVSRAFSASHPVAADTRARIFTVADELGYVPDLLARAMVQKRIPVLGVAVLELANPFFSPIINAIQAEARKHNYLVMVSQSERTIELEQDALNQFKQMKLSGILVSPVSTQLEHVQKLSGEGIPVIVFAREWQGGSFVTVDDFGGGRMVGEHLVNLGHKKIGCVALDEPYNSAQQRRMQGFEQVIKETGTELEHKCLILTESLRTGQGRLAADRFMQLSERPTAVFVTADNLALGFIHRLIERGVRIPGDLAVVGYDDIYYSKYSEVPLTTVALPKYEMGQRAAQIMFELIEGGGINRELHQIFLRPDLVIRKSCGGMNASEPSLDD